MKEKIALTYHTTKGVLQVMTNLKRVRFKAKDEIVQREVRLIITGRKKTIKDVPNIGNLRSLVQDEVNRIKNKKHGHTEHVEKEHE